VNDIVCGNKYSVCERMIFCVVTRGGKYIRRMICTDGSYWSNFREPTGADESYGAGGGGSGWR
jgi:hypothetical protein